VTRADVLVVAYAVVASIATVTLLAALVVAKRSDRRDRARERALRAVDAPQHD